MSEKVYRGFDIPLDAIENSRQNIEHTDNQGATSSYELNSPLTIKCNAIEAFLSKYRRIFKILGLILLNILVIAYLIYAGFYWKEHSVDTDCDTDDSDDKHCTNYWCDGYGMLIILIGLTYLGIFYFLIVKRYLGKYIIQCCQPLTDFAKRLQSTKYGSRIGETVLYAIIFIAIIIFLVFDTVNSRERLTSGLGIIVILGLGWIFSKHPRQVKWRTVILGLILQFIFGLITIRWPLGRSIFECISGKVASFLKFANAGSNFVFSEDLINKGVFAFAVLPVIFFFSFVVQVMCYLGVMQWIIMKLGWTLQCIMGTTLCESLIAVANPFIGMSESPLLIKPYIDKLTSSELHAVMSSGFSTVAGSVLAAYINYGAQPTYLITASVMSAPASLCYSKLFYPETEKSLTKFDNIKLEKSSDTGILDAAINGALAAIPIVLSIIANIVAFVSFIAFFNAMLSWCGGLVGYKALSLEMILAKVFMPLSWIMGVPWEHCEDVGTLIGLKTVVNEMIAYQRMGEYKKENRIYGRSEAIATFAICGFANPGSIGIMIGGLSSLAPEKKEQITTVAVRAFVAGCAVCFLTASMAGILLEVPLTETTIPVSNITSTTTIVNTLLI